MKIIRPEQPIKKKEENLTLFINNNEVKEWKEENSNIEVDYEKLMDEVIEEKKFLLDDENKFKVTILFTERQYNLWKNKGGEKWLKKALVGQKYSPHGRGKKKKK